LKYGEGNWEKGLPTSDVLNHAIEHLTTYVNLFREALSIEARYGTTSWNQRMANIRHFMSKYSLEDDHLAAAAWGIAVLMVQEDTQFFHDPLYEKESPREVSTPVTDQGLPRLSYDVSGGHSSNVKAPTPSGSNQSCVGQGPDGPSRRTSPNRG